MPQHNKSDMMRKMLNRPRGSSIHAMYLKTGWQSHSVHAFLSGLRKSGHSVTREGTGPTAVYRLSVSAKAEP